LANKQPEDPEVVGHEPVEADARSIWIGLGGIFAILFIAMIVIAGLVALFASYRSGQPTKTAVENPIEPPPGTPELDANQNMQLRVLRTRERKLLTEYGWVDQQAGLARIPIERAMQISAQGKQ